MYWLRIKAKFIVLMLIMGSCLIVARPTHTDAQTATKSTARVGFYETGQPQNTTQTEIKNQDRLPQTGTHSVWLSTTLGIILLIGNLGLYKQKRRDFYNEKIYD